MTKSIHSQIYFNIYYPQKLYLNEKKNYITTFSEKFPNQWRKNTNSKVSSNILPLYKVSS